jgi:hypothetical protein
MSETDLHDDAPSPTETQPIAQPPSDAEALLQNFLTVDHPNRGKLFEDMVARIEKDEKN